MPALITFIVLQLTLLVVIFGRPKKQSAYILAAKEEKRVRYSEAMALTASSEAEKDKLTPERTTELPESTRLLSLLYDDVDGNMVTAYGIDANHEDFKACSALLDRSVRAEVEKVRKLSEAALKPAAELTPELLEELGTSAKEVSEHADGVKLDEAMESIKSIRKKLGRTALSATTAQLEKTCQTLRKRMVKPARAAKSAVVAIGLEVLPLWLGGVGFMLVFSFF